MGGDSLAKNQFLGCRQGNVIYSCSFQLLNEQPDRGDPNEFANTVAKVGRCFDFLLLVLIVN